MKFVLLTTSVWSQKSSEVLNRLMSSIKTHKEFVTPVCHIVLLQNWPASSLPGLTLATNHSVTFIESPTVISLSSARNLMLKYCVTQNLIASEDIVAFPDDDCWYPHNSLKIIISAFSTDTHLDFLFCKYCEDNHDTVERINTSSLASATDIVRNASSNTLFLKGHLVLKIGGFDLQLGVGTVNNGGEDLDYAIKAYLAAEKSVFSPIFLIGHRNKDNLLRGKYFRGSAIALRRFFISSPGFCYEYLRKLAIGILLVLRKEMSAKELFLALKLIPANAHILRP